MLRFLSTCEDLFVIEKFDLDLIKVQFLDATGMCKIFLKNATHELIPS